MSQEFVLRHSLLATEPWFHPKSDQERGFQEISHKANTNTRQYYMHLPGASGIDCLVTSHFLFCKDKEGLMVGGGKWCQVLVRIHYLIYRGPVSWACIFMWWHVFTLSFQHSYKSSTYVIRELSSTGPPLSHMILGQRPSFSLFMILDARTPWCVESELSACRYKQVLGLFSMSAFRPGRQHRSSNTWLGLLIQFIWQVQFDLTRRIDMQTAPCPCKVCTFQLNPRCKISSGLGFQVSLSCCTRLQSETCLFFLSALVLIRTVQWGRTWNFHNQLLHLHTQKPR